MANEVKIEISLEEKQALDALTKLIKKTDDFSDNFQKQTKQASITFDVFKANILSNAVSKGFDLIGKGAKELFKTFIVDGIKASEEFKKLKGSIQDYISQNETVKQLQVEVSKAFAQMAVVVKQNEGAIKNFISNAVIFAVDTFVVLTRALDYLIRGFQVFPDVVNIAGQAIITGFMTPLVMAIDGINAVIESVPLLKEKFGTVGVGIKEIFDASAGSAVESIDAIDKKFSESTFLSGIADAASGVSSNLTANKGKTRDASNDPEVIFEQEKQALLTQLREEASLLEGEKKILQDEEALLEGEAKLANIEAQAMLEADLKNNFDSMKLAQDAKTKTDMKALDMKFDKENLDAKKKAADDLAKMQKAKRDAELADRQTFLSTASTLAQSENATLAAIGKAAAITQIAIATPPAVASSFKFGASIGGPPLGFAFGGIAAAAMGAQAAKIAGIKGFQQGGFVGGNSIAGDQNIIRANSDEFVATRAQQRNMIESMANGSSKGGMDQVNSVIQSAFNQPIVVQINEREIARATRNSLKEGYSL